jgi:hypothetical protein
VNTMVYGIFFTTQPSNGESRKPFKLSCRQALLASRYFSSKMSSASSLYSGLALRRKRRLRSSI